MATPAILIQSRYSGRTVPNARLTLPFEQRQKSRVRAALDDGREIVVILERGQSLRDGDLLHDDNALVVEVKAKPEPVSVVHCSDALLLCRAAYHLGNRHMPLQIAPGELRYAHDHVLDDMVRQMGLEPAYAELPFEPESGAYGSGHGFASRGHSHSHSHGHSHGHSHVDAPGTGHHDGPEPAGRHAPSPQGGTTLHGAGKIHTHWDDTEPT